MKRLLAIILVLAMALLFTFPVIAGDGNDQGNGGGNEGNCVNCGEDCQGECDAVVHVCVFVAAETVDPTCTVDGYTIYRCSCGETIRGDIVEATGHEYEAAVTAPTCTKDGFTTYTCACGDSYVADVTAMLGHDYVGGICSRCGEIIEVIISGNYVPQFVLDALEYNLLGNFDSSNIVILLNGASMQNGTYNISSNFIQLKSPILLGEYFITNKVNGLTYTFVIK